MTACLQIGVIGVGGRGGLARHAQQPDQGSRLRNFGNGDAGSFVALWNSRTEHKPHGDIQVPARGTDGGHGGADPAIVTEFIRFVRDEAPPTTSPVAARHSVAAGVKATESLRAGGQPQLVPPLAPASARYFA